MNSVPLWFERKFDFNFPVEQYPNFHVRLWGTPTRLEEMLRSASRDVLIEKPAGKWSAQEHAGHLADLEPLWMARVNDFLTDVDTLTVADLTNRKTDEANHNGRKLEEILAQFRTARVRLLERLRGFQPELFTRTKLHPRLKQPMRHHLAKIWEMTRVRSQNLILS
jgi:uncharacterized damage-inducible protein DinB